MATSSGCTRESKGLELADSCITGDGSHDSESYRTAEQTLYLDAECSESMLERSDSVGRRRSVEERIECSKSHWTESVELDDEVDVEQVKAANVEVFKALQSHPTWFQFFKTFGYDVGIWDSSGELVVGEKFAEGGQAKLYHAHVTWKDQKFNEYHLNRGTKWVLKVFKEGTLLQHLQSQWPQGMLEYQAEAKTPGFSPPDGTRWFCHIECGTLLEDGRFAFLMEREDEDLRTFIDRNKVLRIDQDCGPFSKKLYLRLMYRVARGMEWLHNHDIIHRDLKASNVLVHENQGVWNCHVADYECSVGVIGTGFWRAPEILQACKDRSICRRMDLFTKKADVYSYGITCYEILTGKLPFEDVEINFDSIINGRRPEVPKYVGAKVHRLLCKCWQSNPLDRPSFDIIVKKLKKVLKPYLYEDDSDIDKDNYIYKF